MLSAKCWLGARDIKGRSSRAGAFCAQLFEDVDHAVRSVFPAVRCLGYAVYIIHCTLCAAVA